MATLCYRSNLLLQNKLITTIQKLDCSGISKELSAKKVLFIQVWLYTTICGASTFVSEVD
jgi:hypothetical protein